MEEKELFTQVGMLFLQYGIKSMTMDEISRQLGISKKTLYQFVDNKKDLVNKIIVNHTHQQQCGMEEAIKDEENAIDVIMEITKMVGEQMKNLHPSIMFDLKKYYPEAFKILLEHKEKFIYKLIKKNLEVGVNTGYYRDNLNPELITRLYISMVNTLVESDFTQEGYSYSEFHTQMMRYHIRGIASPKGREYLKQKFNQDNV